MLETKTGPFIMRLLLTFEIAFPSSYSTYNPLSTFNTRQDEVRPRTFTPLAQLHQQQQRLILHASQGAAASRDETTQQVANKRCHNRNVPPDLRPPRPPHPSLTVHRRPRPHRLSRLGPRHHHPQPRPQPHRPLVRQPARLAHPTHGHRPPA